jgi:D-proline reductase (dithiol) PrdB
MCRTQVLIAECLRRTLSPALGSRRHPLDPADSAQATNLAVGKVIGALDIQTFRSTLNRPCHCPMSAMPAPPATRGVDSYRFLDRVTARVVRSWVALDRPLDIPWTPLAKPLADCTVALLSSGGIALRTDQPFDGAIERADPWWSDPSFRVIPRNTVAADIKVHHLHINPAFAEQDLNCLLPLQPLAELESDGSVGRVAPSHYSYMGYTLRPLRLLDETVPRIVASLRAERVDAVVLVPA